MLGINKLLAFLRRQVGLRDDAASATGSLHAKVTDVKASLTALTTVQRGYTNLSTASADRDIAISATTLSKSFVISSFWHNSSTASLVAHDIASQLTSTTNLRLSAASLNNWHFVCWEVIQIA